MSQKYSNFRVRACAIPRNAISRRRFLGQMSSLLPVPMIAAVSGCGGGGGGSGGIIAPPPPGYARSSISYLSTIQDQFNRVGVYTDSDAAGNYFVARGRISSAGDEAFIPVMDEANIETPFKGATCIRCRFTPNPSRKNWGGWIFLSGTLTEPQLVPTPDFGTSPSAGIDLTGATKITFYARSKSRAKVAFFVFGVGWDEITGNLHTVSPYPDTAPKIQIGPVQLSPEWRQYSISIPANFKLTRINGGFGWACTAADNPRAVDFDLDEIGYNLVRKDLRGFLVSFETTAAPDDKYLRNVAYSYDNAVAAIAFLVGGEPNRAKRIADGFVYAVNHDRYYARRVRNGYQGGPLILFPGWIPNGKSDTVRLPGWYDPVTAVWYEDRYAVSAMNTGIQMWVCLALLAYYDTAGGAQYLETARALADEVLNNCWDARGKGGFTAGYEGFDRQETKQLYKSSEHAIDVYPVAMRLYYHTKDAKYLRAAEHAKQFLIEGMWNADGGHFWTGTTPDGVTLSKEIDGKLVIPSDAQNWLILALGKEASRSYWSALDFALTHMKAKTGDGISFSTANTASTWYEGTGQAACAAYLVGRRREGDTLMAALRSAQLSTGGVPATNAEVHFTGFFLSSGKPWNYYKRVAVAGTAWMAIAEAMAHDGARANPYWFGHPGTIPGN